MSLCPYIFNDWLNELQQRPTLFDQHFGHGIPSSDLISWRPRYIRPWRWQMDPSESGFSNLVSDKDGFKVNLDVQQFKPEELNVKVVDGYIVVDGKHEERSDEHGFISRQFTRRYKLPQDINIQALESKLSSDGVLTLHAPKVVIENAPNERTIPIKHTNQPALKQQPAVPAKEDKKEKSKK